MASKKQKLKKRILDALNPQKELSTDKGDFVRTKTKLTKKVRRHSGRYTPQLSEKGKFSEMITNAEEPGEEYDEWIEYRDGFRDKTKLTNPDLFLDEEDKMIAKKRNEKIKKQLEIRKAKKDKDLLKGETFYPEND